jgi:hypothetical protein
MNKYDYQFQLYHTPNLIYKLWYHLQTALYMYSSDTSCFFLLVKFPYKNLCNLETFSWLWSCIFNWLAERCTFHFFAFCWIYCPHSEHVIWRSTSHFQYQGMKVNLHKLETCGTPLITFTGIQYKERKLMEPDR